MSLAKERRNAAAVRAVMDVVASEYGMSKRELLARNQQAMPVAVRGLAIWALRKLAGMTWEKLGAVFNRDPSSVRHACLKVDGFTNQDDIDERDLFLIEVKRLLFDEPTRNFGSVAAGLRVLADALEGLDPDALRIVADQLEGSYQSSLNERGQHGR